jgi:multicomponent Na+:H+ antiporter subunit F
LTPETLAPDALRPENLTPFTFVMNGVLAILCVAMFLAFWRLLRGPTLPDRVVALDLIALLSVGFIAMYDIVTNDTVFLDVAIVLGLVAFLGTVAFARYVERGAAR